MALLVSIHAPGRGATHRVGSSLTKTAKFQFTHPGGVRQLRDFALSQTLGVSIHAPGRGATDYPYSFVCRFLCFNSRTREGCDRVFTLVMSMCLLFQFTHPGGVRLGNVNLRRPATKVSIHAPGRGATSLVISDKSLRMQFQFTHPGGVRLKATLR